MTELSAAAKAILDSGQAALSPSAATKAGVLQGVESNLASAPASAAAASSATTSVLSLKLVLGVVVAVGIGGGLWLSRTKSAPNATSNEGTVAAIPVPSNSEFPEPASSNVVTPTAVLSDTSTAVQVSPPTTVVTATTPPKAVSPVSVDTALKVKRSSATTDRDERDEKRHLRTGTSQAKVKPTKSPAASTKSTLADEQKLIAAAQIAIRKADYSGALTLLKSHSTDFPRGILAPERDAATAIAQCMSGQSGKAAGRRFLDKHSQSPLAARVRTSCKLP